MSFSVRPSGINTGSGLLSADVGIGIGATPFEPYAGVAGAVWSARTEFTTEWWDDYIELGPDPNVPVEQRTALEDEDSMDGTANLRVLIPMVGVRIYLGGSDRLRPYVFGAGLRAFTSIKVDGTWTRTRYYSNGQVASTAVYTVEAPSITYNYTAYNEAGQVVEDSQQDIYYRELDIAERFLSPYGAQLGFGCDYQLAEGLSVIAEASARFVFFSSGTINWVDEGERWMRVLAGQFKTHLGITRSCLGIRYRW
jgi:hypothetical protein